ncbi:MAG: citramalate synthase [Anaerolineae bacterium]|nr:citramalate synthase [Anaerolineae bacterium]
MAHVEVYDTTLRDGTQREGISLSVDDKLKITRLLDDLGVAYIEGGWPGSNPKDAAYFARVRDLDLKHARVAAFGMTCRVGSHPEEDANIQMMVDSQAPVVTIVGKTSLLHVREVIRATPEENLRIIRESVAYVKALGREVIYDAEHFFDGYRLDAAYALETLRAALAGGAERLVLCDTNGGAMPWEVEQLVRDVAEALPGVQLGIHAHNDSEVAVANTLAAVRTGFVDHVQGTINGYGERCGNANLCAIIPDLELKLGLRCLPEGALRKLAHLSRTVAEVANLAPDNHLAYVGRSAFAHKGGMHVAAIRRNADSYQHVDPALVGNEMRVLVSELSGRGNMLSKAEEFGLNMDSEGARAVLEEIKALESQGYVFEGAEASVAMMMRRAQPDYKPWFQPVDFMVVVELREGRGIVTEATVKVRVNGEEMHTAASGNGPVNALDKALRRALLPHYPQMADMQLADYKVRILDGQNGTAATTRVLIDTQNCHGRWSTVGAGPNIIEASWRAVVDSVEYGLELAHDRGRCAEVETEGSEQAMVAD